jgi:hypothetical protein
MHYNGIFILAQFLSVADGRFQHSARQVPERDITDSGISISWVQMKRLL